MLIQAGLETQLGLVGNGSCVSDYGIKVFHSCFGDLDPVFEGGGEIRQVQVMGRGVQTGRDVLDSPNPMFAWLGSRAGYEVSDFKSMG